MKKVINADSHFVIGKMHIREKKPCQDHTRSSTIEEGVYITLSDGCSSGGDTDTGARIINGAVAVTLNQYLLEHAITADQSSQSLGEEIKTIATTVANALCLETEDLLATLLYAVVTPEAGFVHVFGDGVVVLVYEDGSKEVFEFQWKNNTPYYLMYTDARIVNFINDHRKTPDKSFTVQRTQIAADGTKIVSIELIDVEQGIQGYTIPLINDMISNLSNIVLCSDGVESFRQGNTAIPLERVINEVTSFKQSKGAFVKRRLSRMLQDFAKQGLEPSDDVSVAAIHFTTES